MNISTEAKDGIARARLLLLEDHVSTARDLYLLYSRLFAEVHLAHGLRQARDIISARTIDCLISDVQLADGNALDLITELRENGFQGPVLMISAHTESDDLLRAANLDIEGYLVKPLGPARLAPAMEKLGRRLAAQLGWTPLAEGLSYDPRQRLLVDRGKSVPLGERENALLALLAENAPNLVSRSDIGRLVWPEGGMTDSALKNLMGELRGNCAGHVSSTCVGRGGTWMRNKDVCIALLLCLGIWMPALGVSQESLVLQLKWSHQFQFAGYYAALEKGFYRDAGLEVTIRDAEPATDVVREVVTGRADYGVGSSSLLLARHGGDPVVVLGVVFQHSPYVILALQDRGIRTIHDLAGRHMMLEPLADDLIAYLSHERVPVGQVDLRPHTFSVEPLVDGEVDAMSAYITDEPVLLERMGVEYIQFSPQSAGIDFYGDNLFTSQGEVDRHPERAQAFLRASMEGWAYAMAHPEEMIQLILQKYPTSKDALALRYEYEQMRDLMRPDLIEPGYMLPGRWQRIARTYQTLGLLEDESVPQGFLYQPPAGPDYRQFLRGTLVLLVVSTVLGVLLFYYMRLNRRLDQLLYFKSYHATIGRAAGAITHQWRQPLNELAVRMMRLQGSTSGSELDEGFAGCQRIIDHMAGTIDTFASLTGSSRECSSVQLRETLGEILELFRSSMAEHGIQVILDVPENMSVNTDKGALMHVLMVLVANARDMLVERQVQDARVTITVSALAQSLRIQVEDNGQGVRVRPMNSVFRLGFSEKLKPGSGLGLYVARQLVQQRLCGAICVANTASGARFTVELPWPGEAPAR